MDDKPKKKWMKPNDLSPDEEENLSRTVNAMKVGEDRAVKKYKDKQKAADGYTPDEEVEKTDGGVFIRNNNAGGKNSVNDQMKKRYKD